MVFEIIFLTRVRLNVLLSFVFFVVSPIIYYNDIYTPPFFKDKSLYKHYGKSYKENYTNNNE